MHCSLCPEHWKEICINMSTNLTMGEIKICVDGTVKITCSVETHKVKHKL